MAPLVCEELELSLSLSLEIDLFSFVLLDSFSSSLESIVKQEYFLDVGTDAPVLEQSESDLLVALAPAV